MPLIISFICVIYIINYYALVLHHIPFTSYTLYYRDFITIYSALFFYVTYTYTDLVIIMPILVNR